MTQEFIPYELAVKLKELGFDEPCFAFLDAYNGDTHLFFKQRGDYHWLLKLFGEKPKPILEISNWEIEHLQGDGTVLAPTFSQAFRWFREKYNLYHVITIADLGKYESGNPDFQCAIYSKDPVVITNMDKYNIYKEAELACLEKLLEICESKTK